MTATSSSSTLVYTIESPLSRCVIASSPRCVMDPSPQCNTLLLLQEINFSSASKKRSSASSYHLYILHALALRWSVLVIHCVGKGLIFVRPHARAQQTQRRD